MERAEVAPEDRVHLKMPLNYYVSKKIWLGALRQLAKPLTIRSGSSVVETTGFINPDVQAGLTEFGSASIATTADAVLAVKGTEDIKADNETIVVQDGVSWRVTGELASLPSRNDPRVVRIFELSVA